jgi:hypothetical protein
MEKHEIQSTDRQIGLDASQRVFLNNTRKFSRYNANRETHSRFMFHVGWSEVFDARAVNFPITVNYGIDQYEY